MLARAGACFRIKALSARRKKRKLLGLSGLGGGARPTLPLTETPRTVLLVVLEHDSYVRDTSI